MSLAQHDNVALAVEYRDAKAKLLQVTAATDLKDLATVKALYVTVSAVTHQRAASTARTAGPSRAVVSCGDIGQGSYDGLEEAEDNEDDEDLNDGASSVLIDLSLAGCCGVRSTYGGLMVTSEYTQPSLSRSGSSRRSGGSGAQPHRSSARGGADDNSPRPRPRAANEASNSQRSSDSGGGVSRSTRRGSRGQKGSGEIPVII